MCGIVGVIAKDEIGKANFSHLENAVQALYHRGPDANGIFTHKNVGLGHARLSILDTSEGSTQPFTSENDRYVISSMGKFTISNSSDKFYLIKDIHLKPPRTQKFYFTI